MTLIFSHNLRKHQKWNNMMIKEVGGSIHVQFDYHPKIVADIKLIPGRRWNSSQKVWIIPKRESKRVQEFAQRHNALPSDAPMQQMDYTVPPLPELNISIPLKRALYPYQRKGVAYSLEKRRLIIGDQPGLGKAQPLTSKIATPDGWVLMKDVYVGLPVIGRDGKTYSINGVFPQGFRPAYKVTFNDGHSVECDIDHIWSVRDVNRRRRNTGWTNKPLSELIDLGLRYVENPKRTKSGRKSPLKWEIPLCDPFDKPDVDFTIHPYIMGVLLGDGSLCGRSICISIPDSEIETKERIEKLLPNELKLTVNRHPSCPQYHITQTATTKPNKFKSIIHFLGLNVKGNSKFIPEGYMFASRSQRLDLLRGLMDSYGSAKNNRITFHSCSDSLANCVADLVNSLGGQSIVRTYDRTHENKSLEYQVNVKMNECPFYMERKASEWSKAKRNYASRYISDIEYVGDKEQQCISVTAPDNLYLTDHFIVTHNTAQSIATIVAANQFPCLIICPSSLKINWQREWEMWTSKKALILKDSIKNTWPMFYEHGLADVYITNYESLKKYFVKEINKKGKRLLLKDIVFKNEISIFKSVIIDELHKVKDPTTQQTKFVKGICTGKEWILGLTGTPVVNKPRDLFAQLGIIERIKDFGGYKGFLNRYCEGYNGAKNLEELNYILNKQCFYRREKTEVLHDLPSKVRQVVICEINNRREYQDAENDLANYLKSYKQKSDDEVEKSMRGEIMVRIGILKNISARGKLADVMSYIDDVVDAGEKIVVFVHLRDVAEVIQKHYPGSVSVLGKDSQSERQQSIDAFQNDPSVKVIVCSIKAAGVGLTLTAASRVAFVEQSWHAADHEQCEDRCHRIGQKDSVQCTYFLGKDTIDEKIYKMIEEKRTISDTITGATNQTEVNVIDNIINLFNQK